MPRAVIRCRKRVARRRSVSIGGGLECGQTRPQGVSIRLGGQGFDPRVGLPMCVMACLLE
jgi:hypothetical protein